MRERGVRPSYIRLRVLQYLLHQKTHPSAEEVYQALFRDIPTLSRASVYSALRVLSEAGIIGVVMEADETRYDANLAEHGHFRCEVCGRLYDFDFAFTSLRYGGLEDFLVQRKALYFFGICPQCQKGGDVHGELGKNATSGREISRNGSEDDPRCEKAS
ncbi:MAG: Fur family transcriptional regulator [Candidatus Caldatribacteriaceae bacterium]